MRFWECFGFGVLVGDFGVDLKIEGLGMCWWEDNWRSWGLLEIKCGFGARKKKNKRE